MAINHGYTFEHETDDGLLYFSIHGHKIFYIKLPDTHAWTKVITLLKAMFQMTKPSIKARYSQAVEAYQKFTLPKQPGDFWVMYRSISGIFECKSSKMSEMDLFNSISEHQRLYADDIEIKGGGFYYFVFCNRQHRGKHYMVVLRRSELKRLLIRLGKQNRRQVDWFSVIAFATIPIINAQYKQRGGRGVIKWDLSPIFKDIDKRFFNE